MAPCGLLLFARREAVRQRLHEGDERVLLRVRQAEVPDFAPVHVVARFRRGPARRTFAGIMRFASPQDFRVL
jgi:hypothetical protein